MQIKEFLRHELDRNVMRNCPDGNEIAIWKKNRRETEVHEEADTED